MERSVIVIEILLFASFVLLVQTQYAKEEFLAGATTPIWLGVVDRYNVVYSRMAFPYAVVSAINHWKLFHENGTVPFRISRGVDGSENFTRPEEPYAPRDATEDIFHSSDPVEKRSTANNEVVYPSILVVMDYNSAFRTAGGAAWSTEELILYALAFWGSVDASLRNIRNPRVSFRIVGIVITMTREASPYLGSNGKRQSFVRALPTMINYWRRRWSTKRNPDLPIGSYDIVVHMTDSYPPRDINESSDPTSRNEPILAVGSQGPPCILPDEIAGLIVYDDFAFAGLHRTIGQITKVLGGNELLPKDYGWPSRRWSEETLLPLSNALKAASCMSAPKEHHPPGDPVVRILAGEIIPSKNKCAVYGSRLNRWSCWDSTLYKRITTCHFLRCAKAYTLRDICPRGAFTLDGIFCNAAKTKICLDEQCADKQATLGLPQNRDEKPSTTIAPTSPRPLYKKDGFLAGEDTPVWYAKLYPAKDYRYERRAFTLVRPYGLPSIVKKALNDWNALKHRGGFPIRKSRSIYDHGNLTYVDQFHDALSNVGINHFDSPSLIEKRSTDSIEVVYPSILVVMNHQGSRPVEEQVLYALAYWGTVDSSLRHIQNPRVSLRIVGIVIGTAERALPYLMYNGGEKTFVRVLPSMLNYWKSESKREGTKFPTGSYDIVVHMTDIYPWSDNIEWIPGVKRNNPILGVASAGPLCKSRDQIGGIIIYDSFGFNGLYIAMRLMSKVLGGVDEGPSYHPGYYRTWSKEASDAFSNALKNASCMSAPKKYHRPGTPIAPILAGELMPSEKQCELAGYKPNAWTCWDAGIDVRRSTCGQLQCSNDHLWAVTCKKVGPALDGTFCNKENTKICLDGLCVDKE